MIFLRIPFLNLSIKSLYFIINFEKHTRKLIKFVGYQLEQLGSRIYIRKK